VDVSRLTLSFNSPEMGRIHPILRYNEFGASIGNFRWVTRSVRNSIWNNNIWDLSIFEWAKAKFGMSNSVHKLDTAISKGEVTSLTSDSFPNFDPTLAGGCGRFLTTIHYDPQRQCSNLAISHVPCTIKMKFAGIVGQLHVGSTVGNSDPTRGCGVGWVLKYRGAVTPNS